VANELDFQSMIANAKQQHQQRIQQAKMKAEKAREGQTRVEEAGMDWLKRHIIPLLEKAKRAFHAQGVLIEMGSNFGVLRSISGKPTVWFRCIGPTIATTLGTQVPATSKPAYFRCDGQTLEFGLGSSNLGEPWSPDTILSSIDVQHTDITNSIAATIQSVLESYYTELEGDLCQTAQTEELRHRVRARQAKRETKRK
jgi:hypothetical protein